MCKCYKTRIFFMKNIFFVMKHWNVFKSIENVLQYAPKMEMVYCVKSVQMRRFSCIWLNLEIYSPNVGKYGPEKLPHLDSFYAVVKVRRRQSNVIHFYSERYFLWLQLIPVCKFQGYCWYFRAVKFSRYKAKGINVS